MTSFDYHNQWYDFCNSYVGNEGGEEKLIIFLNKMNYSIQQVIEFNDAYPDNFDCDRICKKFIKQRQAELIKIWIEE